MTKLVVSVLLTVLLAGTVLAVIGNQIVPATRTAGINTGLQIEEAFR
ncbi:MAG: hypothetical protein H7X86_02000 [Gorillibacterium sp.]|nr:hypothetical protein [Gorillibacterium sp.]